MASLLLRHVLILGMSIALHCASAAAQGHAPVEGDPEVLFEAGVHAADAGFWVEAEHAFAAVCEVAPTANALLNLATARYHQGKARAALDALQQVGRVPAVSALELETAIRMRVRVEQMLATLAIRVHPDDAALRLDGQPLHQGEQQVRVDPGDHRVDASAEGHADGYVLVEVAAGERSTVQLSLARLPPPVVEALVEPAPVRTTPPGSEADEPDPHRRRRRWLWATGAVLLAGAAATVVGLTTTRPSGVTGCFQGADDEFGGSACAQ